MLRQIARNVILKKIKRQGSRRSSISHGKGETEETERSAESDSTQTSLECTGQSPDLLEGTAHCDLSSQPLISGEEDLPCEVQRGISSVFVVKSGTNDPAEICVALQHILECLRKYPAESVKPLVRLNTHRHVQEIMSSTCNSADVQERGGEILCELMLNSEFKKDIQESDMCRMVVNNLGDHGCSESVQDIMLQLMNLLIPTESCRVQLICENDGVIIKHIIKTMDTFQQRPNIQSKAIQGLILLLTNYSDLQLRLVSEEARADVLLKILKLHENHVDIVIDACRLLILLAQNEKIRKQMVEYSVHKTIVEILKLHGQKLEVIRTALKALDCLLKEEETHADVKKEGLADLLLSYLSAFSSSPHLTSVVLSVLSHAGSNILRIGDHLEEGVWMKQIFTLLSEHREQAAVQESGCAALGHLLQYCPHLHHHIGEDAEGNQLPLHTLCLGSLLMHCRNPNVYKAACNAIYWIAADNYHIQSLLVRKNGHIAIMEGMKRHHDNAEIQECSCRVIRGLCIFSINNKNRMTQSGVLERLVRALSKFLDHMTVQVEVIGAIACMADVALIRDQCIRENVHIKILEAMQKYYNVTLLQEIGLEALTVLTGTEGGPTLMLQAEALDRVMFILKTFTDGSDAVMFYSLQKMLSLLTVNNEGDAEPSCMALLLLLVMVKKTLVLLQLLSDGNFEFVMEDDVICAELAQLVVSVMSQHPNSTGVQAEGCVAMQILAEHAEIGSLMSRKLVDACGHRCLFRILESYKFSAGVKELASECLYVLSCVRNLKSEMLQYACANASLKGVECLVELGADVNIGEALDTPLCHAVKNSDTDMVVLLLQKGVSDVQTAISVSLEKNCHEIIGILLRHIGHDKDAGIVSLSGLSLKDVKPEWLLPTFSGWVQRASHTSDVGKELAGRVRTSKEKRSMRLSVSSGSLPLTSSTKLSSQQQDFKKSNSLGRNTKITSLFNTIWGTKESKDSASNKKMWESFSDMRSFFKTRNSNRNEQSFFRDEADCQSNNVVSATRLWRSFSQEHIEDKSISDSSSTDSISLRFSDCQNDAEQWTDDHMDWRRTTLTGADVPFSLNDPRRFMKKGAPEDIQLSGIWKRKSVDVSERSSQMRHALSETGISSSRWSTYATMSKEISFESTISEGETDTQITSKEGFGDAVRSRSATVQDPFCLHSEDSLCASDTYDGARETSRSTRHSSISNQKEEDKAQFRPVSHLDLSSNAISSLSLLIRSPPDLLSRFHLLEHINLSQNQLEEFPRDLCQHLQQLSYLCLSQNQMSEFPVDLLLCPRLHTLDLSHNKIGGLRVDLSQISFVVKDLNLSYNGLKKFPMEIGQLMPGLEHLNLTGNKLEELPTEKLLITRLMELNVSHNYLTHIPDRFLLQFPHLQSLAASFNELEKLPSEEVAEQLLSLATLHLDHNSLNEKSPFYLPKFILQLPGLRVLNVSSNAGLKGLPAPSLWKTRSLRKLVASHNQIRELKLIDAGKMWPSLERLAVSHNKLSEIPRDIGTLTSLASLDFCYNEQISTLPDELGKLTKLWELPLHGLKLDLDISLMRGRTKDLIGYLHEKLKHSVEYHHMKLMVVGFGGRGKSTLVRALMKVRQPEKSAPTVGILVRDWRFQTSGWRFGKVATYTLSVWDFAGQEEFYSTHQCFLSNRSLYMVVYNLTKGEEEIESLKPWLLNIQARAPDCPVIMVGTHKDQLCREEADNIIVKLRQKIEEMCRRPGFPEIRGMEEVNGMRENVSVERLRVLITDVLEGYKIKNQAVMGQKIPASYVQLQELLCEEKRLLRNTLPIIRSRRLQKIVQDAQIQLDSDELQQAVRFLHESGYLLHYEDASLDLKDLYFVDPEWLCRIMAQVVTVREINPFITDDGILHQQAVKMLFTGHRVGDAVSYTFPSSLIPQYLRLLEKFEIALPISEEELLIPCRLPSRKPNFQLPCSNQYGHLHRIYKTAYIPIGMMARLICRLLVFSKSMLKGIDVDADHISEMKYWKHGIFVCWSEEAFFLVESMQGETDCIDVLVPGSPYGNGLLGHVIDHIESLIDEWYPGLTEIHATGETLISKYVPCVRCPEHNPHLYSLDKLISESELNDDVSCPYHEEMVPIDAMAPDITLGDLERKFHLNQKNFVFIQSPDYLIGEGGYGSVYRATYNNQAVAVKVYNNAGLTHPHKLMRQEASVLRKLNHPSLIRMVAIGLHPRVLLLELAPCGSLGSRLKSGASMSKGYQHKIAMQVADGLSYLHSLRVVYRDLKPDNVLLFSLSQSSLITAKISDYGISRFVTPSGLSLCEGTPGYRAPEVARGEPYSFSADIYSFGITLYELVAGGRHPFDHLNFRSELDEAIIKGHPVDPISKKSAPPWPDMEDLIESCLRQTPETRPTARVIHKLLCHADMPTLQQVIPVTKHMAVECMAVRYFGRNEVEVWVGSSDHENVQLTWVQLEKRSHQMKGKIFKGDRVLCMTAVGSGRMLIGSQAGRICVYDTWTHTYLHDLTQQLSDAVLSLLHVQRTGGNDVVLAGLANGQLAIFDALSVTLKSEEEWKTVILGGVYDSIKCLHRHLNRVYVGCGKSVFVLKLEKHIKVETSWNTCTTSTESGCVSNLAVGKLVYVSKLGSSVVEMWNPKMQKLRHQINMATCLREHNFTVHPRDSRITSLLVPQPNALWVGTGSGHIVLVDTQSHTPVTLISRHTAVVRCLMAVKNQGRTGLVLSAGIGFDSLDKSSSQQGDEHRNSFLGVWEADYMDHYKTLQDNIKRRKDWMDRNNKQ